MTGCAKLWQEQQRGVVRDWGRALVSFRDTEITQGLGGHVVSQRSKQASRWIYVLYAGELYKCMFLNMFSICTSVSHVCICVSL